MLGHYRVRESDHPNSAMFALDMMRAAGHETILFLTLLAEQINQRLEYLLREHGDPWTAVRRYLPRCPHRRPLCQRLLHQRRGSDMHAWAEVYLPG